MAGRRPGVIDQALFVAMVGTVVFVSHAYVGAERFFYSWDHASYQNITVDTAAAFRESASAGWSALRRSFHSDYNAFFALPLVPWVLTFGPSRMSYELGLALVYLVPFPLAVGAVASRIVPEQRRLGFWVAAWLALLTPMTWVPTLRGFPDSGGASLIALALYVHLGDPDLRERTTWWKLGFLWAASILFRRHFAYAVVAIVLAALAHAAGGILLRQRAGRDRWIRLGWIVARHALAVGASVATLFLVAWSYARRFVVYDFQSLYRPYELPIKDLAIWYEKPYGWLTWTAASAGYLLALWFPGLDRSALSFLLLVGAISCVQWCGWARQVGEQYTLHLTPALIIGIVALCWALCRGATRLRRSVVVGMVGGLSLLNLGLALSYPDVGRSSELRGLFAARWPPLMRGDYDEVVRLVRYLQYHARGRDGVFVAASSETLNPDIVRQADRVLSGVPEGTLDVMDVPAVDSVGTYPLGELLAARFVVLAQPFQHHLAPESQRVVRVVYDALVDHQEISADFEESRTTFDLEQATAYVYERVRPTTRGVALATLATMEKSMPIRPGMQPDWVVVDRKFPSWLTRNADGSARWIAHPAVRGGRKWTTLATLDPPPRIAEIAGYVEFFDRRCAGVSVVVSDQDPRGDLRPLAESRRRPGDDGSFRVEVEAGGERLFLSLLDYSEDSSIDYCLLALDPLTIHEAPR